MASGAGLPFIIQYLVPLVTSDDKPEGMKLILILSSIPAAFLLRSAGGFLNAYLMAYAGMHVLEQLRVMVFTKIQYLPLAFFGKNHVGDLMSRVNGDTGQLRSALIKVINSLVKEPATLLSAIGFLIYLTIRESEAIFMLIALAKCPSLCLAHPIYWHTYLSRKRRKAQQAFW